MAKIDYNKLEKEYMTSNISITKLCEKHKCAKSTVAKYSREHDWEKRRTELAQKRTKVTVDKVVELQKDSWDRLRERMLRIIEGELDKYEQGKSENNIRNITLAIKDMRDMGVFGVTTSEKKMLAEIDKLKREAEDDGSKDITVKVMMEDSDEYTN